MDSRAGAGRNPEPGGHFGQRRAAVQQAKGNYTGATEGTDYTGQPPPPDAAYSDHRQNSGPDDATYFATEYQPVNQPVPVTQ